MCAGCPSRSVTTGRSARDLALRLFAAAALAVAAAPWAQAQELSDNEVPIGTFNLGSPPSSSPNGFSIVEPPAGVPEGRRDSGQDGSGRWFFQGWATPKDRSESLYTEAMDALGKGRTSDAQRLFERLISEAPNSVRAGEARQQLGRIYSTVETGAVASTPPGPEGQVWSGGNGVSAKPASLNLSPVLPRATLQRARVSATIDGQFLSDAGDRVFFSAGSADLGARARGVLQSQARFLLQHPELSVAIEGHADDGSLPNEDTVRLSQERAAVVRDRLLAEGVEASRIVAYGRGREDRVSDCPAPECLAQNRRVVTILLEGPILSELKPQRRASHDSAGAPGAPSQ